MALEFSRTVTFGQYLPLDSLIHRRDPRVKILGFSALMAALLITRSFAGLTVALVGAALIQRSTRIPLDYTLRSFRLLLNTLAIVFVFQILFTSPPSQNPIWSWWIFSLSWAGLLQSLATLIRIVLLYHLVTTLMLTTPLMDLADAIEIMLGPLARLRLPINELVMMMVVAIKFVPLLIAELERLIKAQTARGARFDRGTPLTRARHLGAVLIPLFVNAFTRAEVLATAMDARCYRGGRGRTKRRVLTMCLADGVTLVGALVLATSIVLTDRWIGI